MGNSMSHSERGISSVNSAPNVSRRRNGTQGCTFRPQPVSSWSVIAALARREVQTRFGRYRLGYLWAVLDPAAQVGLLTLMFASLGRRDIQGHPFAVFATIGVLGFMFVRQPVERAINAIDANRALFSFRQVLPSDTVLARTLIETAIVLSAALLGAGIALGLGGMDPPPDLLLAVAALCLAWFLALGVSFAVAVVAAIAPASGIVISIFFRALYLLSAIFYPVAALPPWARQIVLLNPLSHAIELIRCGLLSGYSAPGASIGFLISAAVIALLVGSALMRSALPRLRSDD